MKLLPDSFLDSQVAVDKMTGEKCYMNEYDVLSENNTHIEEGNKKILFIIQSYPSEGSANVLCDDNVMQALLSKGKYEIHCLSYLYDGQVAEEIVNGVHVHRWERGLWWHIYTWARHHENNKIAPTIQKANRVFMRIKQLVTIPIFPFYEPLVAMKYENQAIRLMEMYKFDLIIAEHNGLDTLSAGLKIKRSYKKVLYVPVFWDSLSGGFAPKYLPQKYVDYRKKKLESKVLTYADKVIMMMSHKQHIDKLWKKSSLYKKIEFLDIPYLKIQNTINCGTKILNPRYYNIVFAGNMGMRNPEFFFNLVDKCKRKDICICFFTAKSFHKRILDLAKKMDIRVSVNDYLPHNELVSVLQEADLLLNFGVSNPNAVSGKVFEYIGFGKPIISTYFIDDEAVIPILSRYSNALLLDERVSLDSQIEKFEQFIRESKNKKIDSAEILKTYRNNLPETYAEFFQKLFQHET